MDQNIQLTHDAKVLLSQLELVGDLKYLQIGMHIDENYIGDGAYPYANLELFVCNVKVVH